MMTDWQPIDTAPRDDDDILLWDGHSVKMGWLDDDGKHKFITDFGGPHNVVDATHWMSLPEPPK